MAADTEVDTDIMARWWAVIRCGRTIRAIAWACLMGVEKLPAASVDGSAVAELRWQPGVWERRDCPVPPSELRPEVERGAASEAAEAVRCVRLLREATNSRATDSMEARLGSRSAKPTAVLAREASIVVGLRRWEAGRWEAARAIVVRWDRASRRLLGDKPLSRRHGSRLVSHKARLVRHKARLEASLLRVRSRRPGLTEAARPMRHRAEGVRTPRPLTAAAGTPAVVGIRAATEGNASRGAS
jgi:hypothetical protein